MVAPATYKGVLERFAALPQPIREYFWSVEDLVRAYPWEISIAHVFSQIERAKHMTIYCGIVKLHSTDAELTWRLVEADHMSRGRFRELFEVAFGRPIPDALAAKLSAAEKVRDKIIHGKDWNDAQAREALCDAFEFAEGFDVFLREAGGFSPFGDLRGFKGRGEALSKETSHWVLRGMGLGVKSDRGGTRGEA